MANWFQRLKEGLQKSSSKLTDNIAGLLTKQRLDETLLEELEEILIQADLGVKTSADLVKKLAKERFDQDISDEEVRTFLADKITNILTPYQGVIKPDKHKPFVLLMIGVNGSGKTTSMGKLAAQWHRDGYKVLMVACDTFRAAAVEQLSVWSERAEVSLMKGKTNTDPASLAYEAIQKAQEDKVDIVMIDTAGRLQNKGHLMDELKKIVRVIDKALPGAPHATILVLDATTGQNAHSQVSLFQEAVSLSGLIMTKLDGTARGGVLVSLVDTYQIPVMAIGMGETIEDLQPFNAQQFSKGLLGLED